MLKWALHCYTPIAHIRVKGTAGFGANLIRIIPNWHTDFHAILSDMLFNDTYRQVDSAPTEAIQCVKTDTDAMRKAGGPSLLGPCIWDDASGGKVGYVWSSKSVSMQ